MAAADTLLLLVLILEALVVLGMGYFLFRLYRRRTKKVRKLNR